MAYLKFLPCYPDVTPQLVRKGRDGSLCLSKAGREFLSQACLWLPKRYLYQLHFEMCLGNTGRQFFSPRHPLKPRHHTPHRGSRSRNLRGARSLQPVSEQQHPRRSDTTFKPLFSGKPAARTSEYFWLFPLRYPAEGFVDTERGTAAPLSAPGLTWHSGTGPALPHFSRKKGQGRCTDLHKWSPRELSSTSVFQKWPAPSCNLRQVLPDTRKY